MPTHEPVEMVEVCYSGPDDLLIAFGYEVRRDHCAFWPLELAERVRLLLPEQQLQITKPAMGH